MDTLSLRRAAVLCSFAVIASIPGLAGAQAPTLTVTPTSIAAGGSVTASWSNIASPTATDWIGLYRPGAANNAFHATAWIYVSCTQNAGAARASGSCSFVVPAGLAAGTYQLRLLANDGFAVLATSNNFTVTIGGGSGGGTTLTVAPTSIATGGSGGGGTTLTVAPTSIATGGSVTASWSNIATPTSADWIGLYQPGAANNAHHATAWMYVSCSQSAGAARASGSCSFVVPAGLAAGTYQLRLLVNDGFAVLATSNNFTVTTGSGGGGGGSSPGGGSVSTRLVFTPSADHDTLVRHYVLDIFPSSADPTVANAVLSVDLGKFSVVNGEYNVDITAVLAQLWPGTFIATVTAIGDAGVGQSEPSAAFVIP